MGVTYMDTIVSTRLGVRPGWKWPTAVAESLQRTGEHILDQIAFDLMQIMGSGFNKLQHEEMRHALDLVCEATVALDHCHRGVSTPPAIWNVARVSIAAQHKLCSFDPISLDQINFARLPFEICRLSALLYSDLVLFPIPDQTSVKPPLLDDLGKILDQYWLNDMLLADEIRDEPPGADYDLLAWCVLIATAASTSSRIFRPQYLQRLQRLVCFDRRLRDWKFYKNLVNRYLWWSHVLDPLALEALAEVLQQDFGDGGNPISHPIAPAPTPDSQDGPIPFIWKETATRRDQSSTLSDRELQEMHNLSTSEKVATSDFSSTRHLSANLISYVQTDRDPAGSTPVVVDSNSTSTPERSESKRSVSEEAASTDSPPSSGYSLQEFQDVDLLQGLNLFFERLYPILPIVDRLSMYKDLMLGRHNSDLEFASLTLALCSLALVQPVYRAESGSMPRRTERATRMLTIAMKLRSVSFGENMTFDSTVTSYLLFAALSGLGLHKAAWLRLREAVECGRFIGLHQADMYHQLDTEEKARRFRLFLLLSVTERHVQDGAKSS